MAKDNNIINAAIITFIYINRILQCIFGKLFLYLLLFLHLHCQCNNIHFLFCCIWMHPTTYHFLHSFDTGTTPIYTFQFIRNKKQSFLFPKPGTITLFYSIIASTFIHATHLIPYTARSLVGISSYTLLMPNAN